MAHPVLTFVTDLLQAGVRLSTPITLASLGAVICERSGIVNIAMEGMMIIGAFFAVWITYITGNPWLGMLGAMLAGGIFSLIHAAATINLHMDHVVSGAVLNILALGLTQYFLFVAFGHEGSSDPVPVTLADIRWNVPLLSRIWIIGPVFFSQTPIATLSLVLIVFFTVYLYKTRGGLHLRAAGEYPLALETMGVSVARVRYTAVIISGLLCGLAGAFLSIENQNSFSEGMTGGRGFIALAANISGGWHPLGAFLASLFFGLADALQYRFQLMKSLAVPSELFIMFPYIAAVIAVAGLVRRSRSPAQLGEDFIIERESD